MQRLERKRRTELIKFINKKGMTFDMCTIGCKYIKGLGFVVFKNRDLKKDTGLKAIKENAEPGCKRILGVSDSWGHFEGINEKGVAIVHAALKNKKNIVAPTMSTINRYLLQSSSAKEAVGIIRKNRLSGNIVVADAEEAYSIEKTPYSISVKKIINECVMANHSERLRNEGCRGKKREESIKRQRNAAKILKNASKVEEIKAMLKNKESGICNKETKSSYIFITKKGEMLFRKDSKRGVFKKYKI